MENNLTFEVERLKKEVWDLAKNTVARIEQNLENLDLELLSNLSTTLVGINSDLDGLETRVASLEDSLESTTSDLTDLESTVSGISSSLTNTNNTVDTLSTNIGNLSTTVNTATSDIQNTKSGLTALSNTVTNIIDDVTDLNSEVSSVQGSVSDLEDEYSSLSTQVGTNTSDISSLSSTVQTMSSSVTNLSTTVSQNSSSISNLSQNKVDKENGKGLSSNDYTTAEKQKLAGIEENANNFVLPENIAYKADIPATLSAFIQDSTHRTITDGERNIWNAKADYSDIPTSLSALSDDSTHRTVTDAEKSTWNTKLNQTDADKLYSHNDLTRHTVLANGTNLDDVFYAENTTHTTYNLDTYKSTTTSNASTITNKPDDTADVDSFILKIERLRVSNTTYNRYIQTYKDQYGEWQRTGNYYYVNSGTHVADTIEWDDWKKTASVDQIINKNYILNSNFEINSKGQSSYSGAGETVDKWNVLSSYVTVSHLNKTGISFTSTNASTGIVQFVDLDTTQALIGQTVTVSLKSKSTGNHVVALRYGGLTGSSTLIASKSIASSNDYSIQSFTATIPSIPTGNYIRLIIDTSSANGVVDIEWIKMEIGSTATTYEPPLYVEEQWKTKRIFNNVSDLGLIAPTTVSAVMQVLINQPYTKSFLVITNDNNNMFTDCPSSYGTLLIETGTNALRSKVSYVQQIGTTEGYKYWEGNILRSGNTVLSIDWQRVITDKNTSNPSLIPNGDFSANSNGKTIYGDASNTATQYPTSIFTADNWFFNRDYTGTFDVSTKTLSTGTNGTYAILLASSIAKANSLEGKKVTISLNIEGDNIYNCYYGIGYGQKSNPSNYISIIQGYNSGTGKFLLTTTIPNGLDDDKVLKVRVYKNAGSVKINWVKLEIGEIATEYSPNPYDCLLPQTFARVYKSIGEISSSLTTSATILDVMTAMQDNSYLHSDIANYSNLLPNSAFMYGTLEIEKVNLNRASARYIALSNTPSSKVVRMWIGEFQPAVSGYEWSGWKELKQETNTIINFASTQNYWGKIFRSGYLEQQWGAINLLFAITDKNPVNSLGFSAIYQVTMCGSGTNAPYIRIQRVAGQPSWDSYLAIDYVNTPYQANSNYFELYLKSRYSGDDQKEFAVLAYNQRSVTSANYTTYATPSGVATVSSIGSFIQFSNLSSTQFTADYVTVTGTQDITGSKAFTQSIKQRSSTNAANIDLFPSGENYNATPSETKFSQVLQRDTNGNYIGGLRVYHTTDNLIQTHLLCRSQGTSIQNHVRFEAASGATANTDTGIFRFIPSTDGNINLGTSNRRWCNVNLSGVLTDGTNSISVANIASKSDIPTFTLNGTTLTINL